MAGFQFCVFAGIEVVAPCALAGFGEQLIAAAGGNGEIAIQIQAMASRIVCGDHGVVVLHANAEILVLAGIGAGQGAIDNDIGDRAGFRGSVDSGIVQATVTAAAIDDPQYVSCRIVGQAVFVGAVGGCETGIAGANRMRLNHLPSTGNRVEGVQVVYEGRSPAAP